MPYLSVFSIAKIVLDLLTVELAYLSIYVNPLKALLKSIATYAYDVCLLIVCYVVFLSIVTVPIPSP